MSAGNTFLSGVITGLLIYVVARFSLLQKGESQDLGEGWASGRDDPEARPHRHHPRGIFAHVVPGALPLFCVLLVLITWPGLHLPPVGHRAWERS